MKSQACEPCAKRKVRCDKEEPCSNCKRRKQDRCTYTEISPAERIRKLETLVRSLGGDPETDRPRGPVTLPEGSVPGSQPPVQQDDQVTARVLNTRSQDPVLLEEDGQQVYLESHTWQDLLGQSTIRDTARGHGIKAPLRAPKHPDVFQRLQQDEHSTDLAQRYPVREIVTKLWSVFYQRVDPLVRISFRWALHSLEVASVETHQQQQLTSTEHAFLFSIFLISIISLSEEECQKMLRQQRSFLIAEYQFLCEEALSQTNLFCLSDILAIKAMTFYMIAAIDRLSTRSLWTLMGLVVRSAERLGLHRDGSALGLSPYVTEERRRVWWQLQHIDLVLAVRSALTPMTMTADWDTKMPLNIEDEDINADMTTFPRARQGLTSMSYCLYTYWVLDNQRKNLSANQSRFELSWQSNTSLTQSLKDSIVAQLEEGLNNQFLQYCDPIRPSDNLLQVSARFLVCGFRLRMLNSSASGKPPAEISDQHRDALLSLAIQCLEYNVELHSQRSLRHFRWLTKGFFPWHAFMIVLVETSQQRDPSKCEQIWELLSDLYSSNPHLSQLSEDRRCMHAAELVTAAWNARRKGSNSIDCYIEPDWLITLRSKLEEQRTGLMPDATYQQVRHESAGQAAPVTPISNPTPAEQGVDDLFEFTFEDIDWSFWNSID